MRAFRCWGVGALALGIAAGAWPAPTQEKAPSVLGWLRAAKPARSLVGPAVGALPSPEEVFDRNAALLVRPAPGGKRPARLVLTEFLPPVGDQGSQASGACWAAAYYTGGWSFAQPRGL